MFRRGCKKAAATESQQLLQSKARTATESQQLLQSKARITATESQQLQPLADINFNFDGHALKADYRTTVYFRKHAHSPACDLRNVHTSAEADRTNDTRTIICSTVLYQRRVRNPLRVLRALSALRWRCRVEVWDTSTLSHVSWPFVDPAV
jgi:hypothetical protein